MEYTTGDLDLKLRITSEKDVTIEHVVGEATKMWATVRGLIKSKQLTFGDSNATDRLLARFRVTNPELCKSYPTVVRYMCEMHEYSPRAFTKYLRRIDKRPWKTEEEYLESQVDYITILFKDTHPRYNSTQVSNLRHNARALLTNEHTSFKEKHKAVSSEVDALERELRRRNLQELREFVDLAGVDGMSRAETITVVSELDTTKINIDDYVSPVDTAAARDSDALLA